MKWGSDYPGDKGDEEGSEKSTTLLSSHIECPALLDSCNLLNGIILYAKCRFYTAKPTQYTYVH